MESLFFGCPECDGKFEADIVVHRGGVNDYGWWIVACDACGEIFSTWIGRDVRDSNLVKGGRILEIMDRDVHIEEEVEARTEELREQQGKN